MLVLITIASVLIALAMSVVAWRATNEERRRSDARVAALAAEIHEPIDLDLRPAARPMVIARDTFESAPVEQAQDLFAPAPARVHGGGIGLVLAAGGLVLATAAAVAIVFGGGGSTATTPAPTATAAAARSSAAAASTAVPLELIALAHERDEDSLTVRGTVRNPPSGAEVDRLVAVVFLFNRDGGFVASGRAAVESSALIPGGQSSFVVTVPASTGVGRYRVSFRSDDRIISHVDKRNRS